MSPVLISSFFKDLSRGLKSGVSLLETITFLEEQTTKGLLKNTLRKLSVAIIDGHSLKEAFDNTKVFPPLVIGVVDAAEKSGSLCEVSSILSDYFKFINDNKIRVIKALIYPACVFIALTVASIVISITLVPQLSSILPVSSRESLSAKFIIGYALLMQSSWWMVLILFVALIIIGVKIWEYKKAQWSKYIFQLPLGGALLKEMNLAVIFLNLYVYQKSGVHIIAALTHIYSNQPNYVTQRLLDIKILVNQGYSLGEAFKKDDFFPSLISMSIRKGESTGHLYQYFYEIYQYFDQRSRDSIETLISFINPVLLSIAVAYLGLIISCFILPLYSTMSQ